MKTIHQLCEPREGIFSSANQDFALNLKDFLDNGIDAAEFFEENYVSHGMTRLFELAFSRFAGKDAPAVIKLTQAMGGGKTHNMIALGLLARDQKFRKSYLAKLVKSAYEGEVRVVGFHGRETDYKFGIWGAIAKQLNKFDTLNDYYSPLKAPGETTWTTLLKDEKPLLILLDELPPYMENAKAQSVGNSDLSAVTTTALANLFTAVSKSELSNVFIVISDLTANYREGMLGLNEALRNMNDEVNRTATGVEPVALNTDEIYQILRKRIFKRLPEEKEIKAVADGFHTEFKKYQQANLTRHAADTLRTNILESYPFHPLTKDVFARFKENPGFQQTRGLIRLMRTAVANMFSDARKEENIWLIAPQHFNLRDSATYNICQEIHDKLGPAVSHDIAGSGAVAEEIDAARKTRDAQAYATTIYLGSLATVSTGKIGFNLSDLTILLAEPGRDLSLIQNNTLTELRTNCWYLHVNKDGEYYFREVENIAARLKRRVQNYSDAQRRDELRRALEEFLKPVIKDCYSQIFVLRPLDEIQLNIDTVSLVVYESHQGSGLHQDLLSFYNNQTYKNRVVFLSGEKMAMHTLYDRAAERQAIRDILKEFRGDATKQNSPELAEAVELEEKFSGRFLMALRDTFTKLYYPISDKLQVRDFAMNFVNNQFNGESEVRNELKRCYKFKDETDIKSPSFRQQLEAQVFTVRTMQFSEIRSRAAMTTSWVWHKPDALQELRHQLVVQGQWRESDGYIDKGPFEPPKSGVSIQMLHRSDETGVATLRIQALNGDQIFYDINAEASSASQRVTEFEKFETSDMKLSFFCLDSSGKHQSGPAVWWHNKITLKYKPFHQGNQLMVELRAAPAKGVEIVYTTDGQNPLQYGGKYSGPFPISRKTTVLAVGRKDGVESDTLAVPLDPAQADSIQIENDKPARWEHRFDCGTTKQTFDFLQLLEDFRGSVAAAIITLDYGGMAASDFYTVQTGNEVYMNANDIRGIIGFLRGRRGDESHEVTLSYNHIKLQTGHDLKAWVAKLQMKLNQSEVKQ